MKTTVIHHSTDYDGIFCREIARKFLPDAELIGWDFGDPPLTIPSEGKIYVMDLPVDRVFGMTFGGEGYLRWLERVIWIDHHKSSIDTHNKSIPGYRIDGVAACRLAWQWFINQDLIMPTCPTKQEFIEREVREPLAVRLAGEYDIWDHRDNDADVAFQFGLDAQKELNWDTLLHTCNDEPCGYASDYIDLIIKDGRAAMRCYAKRDAEVMRTRSFLTTFEGRVFICLNTARCNSNTFKAKDVPETNHDGLLAFYWTGKDWSVSMYHAAHRKDLDLSQIAVKHGGGGHRGACGFRAKNLPFIP